MSLELLYGKLADKAMQHRKASRETPPVHPAPRPKSRKCHRLAEVIGRTWRSYPDAAKMLGCDRNAVYLYVWKHPEKFETRWARKPGYRRHKEVRSR